jgi:hypothetical protein
MLITIVPAFIYNIYIGEVVLALSSFLVVIPIVTIATGILIYYRNIVTDVEFMDSNCIIKTNAKIYILPSENFIKVEVNNFQLRTFIYYQNNAKIDKFIFQMKYSPFKTYHLNIDEMKKNFINAIFIEN